MSVQLFSRLTQLLEKPEIEHSVLRDWTHEPIDLDPWNGWLLLGLVHHRNKQYFVEQTIKTRLLETPNDPFDPFSRQLRLQRRSGIVPGLSEWEFYFHGLGCCLTNRITGEEIDVDFYEDSSDWFTEWFLVRNLKSLRDQGWIENRVLELHPSVESIGVAIEELTRSRYLESHDEHPAFRLTALAEPLKDFVDGWRVHAGAPSLDRNVAIALSDWELVQQLDPTWEPDAVQEQLDETIRLRNRELVRSFRANERPSESLLALEELQSPFLEEFLENAIQGPSCGTIATALNIIDRRNDPVWCEPIRELLSRIDPNTDIPAPYLWMRSAGYLAKHFQLPDLRPQLLSLSKSNLGDGAVFALEHFPDVAVQLFRKALRSSIPVNRCTAAAALAIIDQPWSRQELLSVLDESEDQIATAEVRSALDELSNQECRNKLEAWEERNPREPEMGDFVSMDEVMLRNRSEWIRLQMQALHDLVYPLRAQRIVPH